MLATMACLSGLVLTTTGCSIMVSMFWGLASSVPPLCQDVVVLEGVGFASQHDFYLHLAVHWIVTH